MKGNRGVDGAADRTAQTAGGAPARPRLLVVGASGGIGRAVRAAAAARGWDCTGADRHAEFRLDLSVRADLEPRLAALFAAHGPFDAVVFAAGVCPVIPLSALTAEKLAETQLVNSDAFILLVKAFAASCARAGKGGRAVAVSSVSARAGWSGGAAYCASKGALSAAARALDAELAPRGIAVRAVEPGHVLTGMFLKGAGRMGVPASAARAPEALAEEILDGLAEGLEEKEKK